MGHCYVHFAFVFTDRPPSVIQIIKRLVTYMSKRKYLVCSVFISAGQCRPALVGLKLYEFVRVGVSLRFGYRVHMLGNKN